MEKNMIPAISVVMSAFNSEAFLHDAIQSVLDQTFSNFEFIIIDDGSTDRTAQIIQSFSDPRIRFIQNKNNLGLIASLNKGIALAKASLIARMDADDIMLPSRLAIQEAFMRQHPEVTICAGKIVFINTEGERIGVWDVDQLNDTPDTIRRGLAKVNCIAHPSVMMRTTIVQTFKYAPYQKNAEDWDLWMRLLNAGYGIAKVPEDVLLYRVHSGSITADDKKKSAEWRLLKHRGKFIIRAFFQFRWSAFLMLTLVAQARTFLRYWKLKLEEPMRKVKRIFTYSPIAVLSEKKQLRRALENFQGKTIFIFPYVHVGGAEQVHADIVNAISDKNPLVIICGFSKDQQFLHRFKGVTCIIAPHYLNHPWTHRSAHQKIARALNHRSDSVLFGSNAASFFETVPFLDASVSSHYLIHAFKFDLTGNTLHKAWLKHLSSLSSLIFISQASRNEYQLLLKNNGLTHYNSKLQFISNATPTFVAPKEHNGISVLMVGRPSSEKRVHLFARLAEHVREQHPEVSFRFIGTQQLDHAPMVECLGEVHDSALVSEYYQSHDLLVLTSSREGFPLVIMEAMAHGCVPISTAVGDIPNRLKGSESKIILQQNEEEIVSEMKSVILHYLKHKDQLFSDRQACYAFAQREFSPQQFTSTYRKLLQ